MPSVHQPATALRDRAERHVFETVPELPATERRVLALLELAGADRAAVLADTGLAESELRPAATRARKALRRTRAPLGSGARCEQAEQLISDRLDAVGLQRPERKWLEVHLARCPRCIEHAAALDEARAALRASFAEIPRPAPRPAPPPADPVPDRAKLRVVPAPPALPPADEPPALLEPPAAPAIVEAPRQRVVRTRSAAPAPAERAGRAARAARVAAIVLVVAAVLAAAAAGLSALSGGGQPTAPWARPGSPDVRPPPLSGQ
jgi:hypothetical protein